ncbi:MAG TPA: kelch repeat-containing protein [Xanthobacteraceae bacterium]
MTLTRRLRDSLLYIGISVLAACSSSSHSSGTGGTTTLTVGGSVTGLVSGTSVVLADNGDAATVTANGSYSFTATFISGASYDVTVEQQPAGANCVVTNGSGTIGTSNIANILVTCTPNNYTISGTLAGLLGGRSLTLQDNAGNSTTVAASGSFVFSSPVASGSNYAVTILSQPAGQTCSVTNGSGIIAAADITNVSINCSDNTYNVAVSVMGLGASGLVLQNNGADNLAIAASGTFNFNTPVASGSAYSVTIASQPLGGTCTVGNGSGTVVASNVSDVTVTCVPNLYPISGTLSGLLSGRSVTVQDNGANSTVLSVNGAFNFSTPVASGSNYSVTIFSQPAGQSCSVSNGSGTVAGSAVGNVGIACSDNTYNIGVAVSGVIRSGLVLQDNGGDNLAVAADGSFNFATPIASGSAYAVTLLTQPAGENCAVTSGSGTVVAANVGGIPVVCTPINYSIGGSLTGLLASNSVILQDNGGNNTTLAANGGYTFSGPVASGSTYAVTVSTQPPGQTCSVTSGSGTVISSNVSNVNVDCSDNTYNIGVTVSGLNASGLVLQDNGGDNLTISVNGSLNFASPVASGSGYNVTTLSQPIGEICAITGGSGIVASSNVAVTVVCTPNNYTVSGVVSGLLSGNSVTLQNNGSDDTVVAANSGFNFSTPVASGSTYAVTVSIQPPGQTCSVSNGSGTIAGANVSNVAVGCSNNTYNIGVTVSGLNASGLVLQDNGGDNLTISANGSVNFATPVASGSTYAVTILSQPAHQSCAVSAGSGTVTSSDVTGIAVSCTNTYTIGGTVSGLVSSGLVLQDNGADDLTISTTGNFTFATAMTAGGPYAVTILTQPSGQTCSVGNGSGTVTAADITNISVTCGNVWTWVAGSNVNSSAGIYGTQGVASISNVPGARLAAISWTDTSGNLWLFGGNGYDSTATNGNLNDLWEFNPTAGTWDWVSGSNSVNASGLYGTQGVASASNAPGARDAAMSWSDSSGLWLFGGNGPAGFFNDLWLFNPTAGTWEWVSGSNSGNTGGTYGTQGVASTGNVPGARIAAVSWTDSSGNLWLFGGYGYDSSDTLGYLNDLWEFNPAAGTWEWVSGSNTIGASGVYGTQGVASISNVPGARSSAVSWRDLSGNLWLFGGNGYDSSGVNSDLNDLWELNPLTGIWVWVSGSNSANAIGVYGTQGLASASNIPGSRNSSTSWSDSSGNLWLFGGSGYFNDLWKFDPTAGTWEWVGGSNSTNVAGVYGSLGVASTSNMPGARATAISWTDSSGNLWLFGGNGQDSSNNLGPLGDLWKYTP